MRAHSLASLCVVKLVTLLTLLAEAKLRRSALNGYLGVGPLQEGVVVYLVPMPLAEVTLFILAVGQSLGVSLQLG